MSTWLGFWSGHEDAVLDVGVAVRPISPESLSLAWGGPQPRSGRWDLRASSSWHEW